MTSRKTREGTAAPAVLRSKAPQSIADKTSSCHSEERERQGICMFWEHAEMQIPSRARDDNDRVLQRTPLAGGCPHVS
jgi:hypothetical protein